MQRNNPPEQIFFRKNTNHIILIHDYNTGYFSRSHKFRRLRNGYELSQAIDELVASAGEDAKRKAAVPEATVAAIRELEASGTLDASEDTSSATHGRPG